MARAQYVGSDIAEAYFAGQQARQQRDLFERRMAGEKLRQQQLKDQMALQKSLPGARQEFFAGEPSQLQQLAPREALELSKAQEDIRKTRFGIDQKQKEAIRSDQLNKANLIGKAYQVIQNNPQAYGGVRNMLERQAGVVLPDDPAQADWEGMYARANQSIDMLADPDFESAAGQVALEQGFTTPTQAYQENPNFMDDVQAFKIRMKKAGRPETTITIGGQQKLEKKVRGDVQSKLIENMQLLQNLDAVASVESDEFLTLGGRARVKIASLLDHVGLVSDDESVFLSKYVQFKNEAEQIFNDYKRAVTGAAGSEQELNQIRDSIMHKKLGPVAFKAALGQMREVVARTMRLQRRLLRSNLPVNEVNAQAGAMFKKGIDAKSMEDIVARRVDLQNAGLDDSQIAAQLLNEGYIDEEQAMRLTAAGAGQ